MSKSKKDFKPVYRLIPASLKPRFESGEFDVKCLFLVSELAYEVLKKDRRPQSHLPRDRTAIFLKDILTKNYRRTVDLLISKSIIQVNKNKRGIETYSTTHHHCKQYSLTKKYRDELNDDGVSGLMISDHRQLKRMSTFWGRSTIGLIAESPWLEQEVNGLKRLVYLQDDADSFLKEVIRSRIYRNEVLNEARQQTLLKSHYDLNNFLNTDKLPHVSISYNRVTNKLVNANREYREYIRTGSGEKLVEVDMRSAQWVMLCKALVLMCKHSYSTNLIDNLTKHIEEPIDLLSHTYNDIRAFVSAVLFQDIYSEFGLLKDKDSYVILAGYRHPNRDMLKHEAIAETLYSFFTNPDKDITRGGADVTHIRQALRRTYRSVYEFLKQCANESKKKKRSSDLAILMQQYEGFFFHQVLQKALEGLLEGEGYAIIHDAFYLPESKVEAAKTIMKNTAEEWFGVREVF